MKTEGIILSAGLSGRMGAFKPEMNFRGKPLAVWAVSGFREICSRVIVVGGHRVDIIWDIFRDDPLVEVVYNSDYQLGMFSSVQTGVRAISGDDFFILPVDIPFVSCSTYQKLAEAEGLIRIPVYRGKKGHPVRIDSCLADELLAEPADSNLKLFIQKKGFSAVEVDDSEIMFDIDTKDDYDKAIERVSQNKQI